MRNYSPNQPKKIQKLLFGKVEGLASKHMGGLRSSHFLLTHKRKKMETIILADMESNGMYFSEDVKDELEKQREEFYCEYSGLLSVKAYEYVK